MSEGYAAQIADLNRRSGKISTRSTGVVEAMKDVLVKMYEEETQPADPIA